MTDERENGLRAFQTLGEFLAEDGWHPQQCDLSRRANHGSLSPRPDGRHLRE